MVAVANTVYNIAKTNLLNDLLSTDIASGATYKVLLIQGSNAPNPDNATVTAVLSNAAELSGATGYTGGAGGSGRKTVTFTVTQDDTNDRTDAVTSTASWTGLNSGTVRQFLVYRHVDNANDSLNIPVFCVDTATGLTLTLNGSDVSLAAQTLRLT